ncbi:hypothetical protein AB4501_23255 [Vibrio sp. 10N.222.55.E8]|uniref:hypothetical protein n=1 Tax=Vibrio artabrorum TaxID=446374 RepID=UPI003551D56E
MYQLEFKALIKLWDNSVYSKGASQSYDAQYAIDALFSVEAFSSNPRALHPIFCREALDIFLQDMRDVRHTLTAQHAHKKEEWGDITLIPFITDKHKHEMKIEQHKLCRSAGLLLKTFDAANRYLHDLYRAKHNEEISEQDFMTTRNEIIKSLSDLIFNIATKSQLFHAERKKLESVNG